MAKIIFMGTPDFAVPVLKALIEQHEVIGVITQPDRPVGRKQLLNPPPVKTVAMAYGIPIYQPEKLRGKEAIRALRAWQKEQPDFYIVAAFGQILPQEVLDIPVYGSINVHASLLPRWRGAAPIHAAILAGDKETGVTIMRMDAGLDTGPMLSKASVAIEKDDTLATLHDKLATLGAELLIKSLPDIMSGKLLDQIQEEELVTYAPQLTKADGQINWNQTAVEIDRQVRAFTPWPGSYSYWNGKNIKILQGTADNSSKSAQVGEVIAWEDRFAIACKEGVYQVDFIQIEGKSKVTARDFLRGYPQFIGEILG
ncbi:methionyl-tRNA formyltransferase [Anaerolineales bacterium]